jgi:hypothetical protein
MMRKISFAIVAALFAAPVFGADWGTIKGQIVFAGVPPEVAVLKVDKDLNHCLQRGPIKSENWVINPNNKGVKNVFVWITGPGGAKPAINPALQAITVKTVKLDQPCCAFEPHCLGVREGQKLDVTNTAPIAHNVSWIGGKVKNPGGNVIVPPGKSHLVDLKADKQPIAISCNIHTWMKGWVWAFDHPYFAVTDADGNFEIKDAPAGPLQLVIWQEDMGWKGGAAGKTGETITVKAGANNLGTITIKP